MKKLRFGLLLVAAAFAAGCAHPMIIKPDVAALVIPASLRVRMGMTVAH